MFVSWQSGCVARLGTWSVSKNSSDVPNSMNLISSRLCRGYVADVTATSSWRLCSCDGRNALCTGIYGKSIQRDWHGTWVGSTLDCFPFLSHISLHDFSSDGRAAVSKNMPSTKKQERQSSELIQNISVQPRSSTSIYWNFPLVGSI